MWRKKQSVLWILAILGLIMFIGLSGIQSTPQEETSPISHEEAGNLAANFLQSKGIDLSNMIRTELYMGDSEMDAYLQRHHLNQDFEKAQNTARPLSYWEVTFFQSGKESYKVYIEETKGAFLGYEILGGKQPQDTKLSEREALRLALVEFNRRGVETSRLDRPTVARGENNTDNIEMEPTKQYDYEFRWRDKNWKVGDSNFIYKVTVTGKQVTSFWSIYEIPKSDQNWFAKQETLGMILTGISLLGIIVFVIFSVIVAFAYPKQEVNWLRGLLIGILLLGIALVTNLNEWPLFLRNMELYGDFPVEIILWGTAVAVTALSVLSSGSTYITAVAGAAIQNKLWPGKWLPWQDGKWPERIKSAAFRGYLIAFLWLGLQAIFYWISEKYFGVWQETDFTSTPWNFLVPGLFPLLAWTAGIGEEITFRLLGTGLVKRYLKSTFLALLIPSMVWALAHSLYPVHPFYTRFVELTLFGMMIGWFFLRYDLETVIFAHVIFDTVLMCLPLLFSESLADQVWAVWWLILPALVGRYSRWLQPKSIRQHQVQDT